MSGSIEQSKHSSKSGAQSLAENKSVQDAFIALEVPKQVPFDQMTEQALETKLQSPEFETRVAASKALLKNFAETALPIVLLTILKEESPQHATAHLAPEICRLNTSKAISGLFELLSAENSSVRQEARFAIKAALGNETLSADNFLKAYTDLSEGKRVESKELQELIEALHVKN